MKNGDLRWVTVAELVKLWPGTTEEQIKRLLNPKLPRRNCPRYIHPEDVKRPAKNSTVILYSVSERLPRLIEKKG